MTPLWRENNKSNLYQIDLTVALGLSLRVGFNPAELLDFVLGWFGSDILDDDVGRKQAEPSRNKGGQSCNANYLCRK